MASSCQMNVLRICLAALSAAAVVAAIGASDSAHCEPGWQKFDSGCQLQLQPEPDAGDQPTGGSQEEARSRCQALGAELLVSDSAGSASSGLKCAKPFSNCAIGWYEGPRTCYQLNANPMSWDEAKSACSLMGADLIQITEEDTQRFVNGYLMAFRKQNIAYIWIGIYQTDRSGPLLWTSGPEVSNTYKNWYPNQPKLSQSQRNTGRVMTITDNGAWEIGVPTESGGYICQLPLGTNPTIPTPDYRFSCPNDWHLFRGSCYQFWQLEATWQGARDVCRSNSPVTDLVDIRDDGEQEFVRRNVDRRDIWIGLHSKPGRWGQWYWNDDQMTSTYYNWNEGEPNNHGGIEFCVEMVASTRWKWNDKSCENRAGYACKRPADVNGSPPTQLPTTTPKPDPICGAGWYRDPFSNQCYLVNLEPMNWNDARLYCQSKRGDLASITSKSEKSIITSQIQAAIQSGANPLAFWMGFNDIAEEGRWVWSDGSPASFINWDYGEPNNYEDDEDCGQILTSKLFWNDETCSREFASVCKKSASTGTTAKPLPTTIRVPDGQSRGCPSGYSGYNNMCYRVFNDKMNWNNARQHCRNEGGDLTSIENSLEHEFVYELTQKNGDADVWIGLHDTLPAERTMYFQWSDGSPVTFTNWRSGEPNDWQDNENCVQQYQTRLRGQWNDLSCDDEHSFVCKRREIALVSTLPTTRPMGCPVDFDDAYNGNCYKYIVGAAPLTWNSANYACRAIGGLLVSILTSEEQGHINLNLYALNAAEPFWIGLARSIGGLAWTGGPSLSPTSYTNWASNANTRDSYAFMYSSSRALGTWSMESTIYKLPNYVCKRRQDGPTTPTPPPTTYDPRFCAVGWVEADNTCYRSFTTTITSRLLHWDEARVYCKHLGGDLASIHSDNATDVLRSIVEVATNAPYWIGLNSRDTDKSHLWVDGSSPNYFNWKPNEPNNFNKKLNCVLLDYRDMKWYVTSCSATANVICETQKGVNPGNVTTMEPTTAPDAPDCDKTGWKYYKGSCYYFRVVAGDWYASRKYCRDNGADLTSILDEDENEFIHRQTAKVSRVGSFWIGLNELGQTDGFKWSDGSAVGYLNWKENEPNNAGGAEHCVTIHGADGLWNDDQCGTNMLSVCKKNNGTGGTDPPATPMPGECPKDYHTVGDKCFRIFGGSSDVVTWQEAFDMCAAWGGVNKTYLASISSEYEQAALIALASEAKEDLWIGLHTRVSWPRKYVWIDNSQLVYSNWDRGEPNGNAGNNENCVEMYAQKYRAGKWNDINCAAKRGYICMTHKQASILTTWPGPQPTRVLCSAGWMQYGSACFRYFDQPARWADAQAQCKSQGGDLASVHDVWEQNYLHWLTRDKSVQTTWLGLTDQQAEGVYLWSDGWPVLYTYWGINQPNDEAGKGCVRMDLKGKWFNGPCTAIMPYLCRISYGPAPTTPPTIAGRCPSSDFVQFGQHCYFISEVRIAANRRNFASAQLECKLMGGDLASITSPGEQDFLAHTIAGLTQDGRVYSNYWIGMARQLEDGFQWLDGSPVSYVHWAWGEPSDKDGSGGENCVEMYHINYQWNDAGCAATNAYVCKVAKRPFTAGPQDSSPTSAATQPSVSVSTSATSRMTQPPGQTSTSTTSKTESGRTTPVKTGRIIADNRNDILVGGVIAGILLLLLVLVLAVFLFRRGSSASKGTAEPGFSNANWSKQDGEAVTLEARPPLPAASSGEDSAGGFSNPGFAVASEVEA